jgi:AAA family ATP:ADP antiporter
MSNVLGTERSKKGFLDRSLGLFTEVKAGEGGDALLLALNVFLLLAAYYILKAVREALVLSQLGAEIKAYLSAGQALLFLLIVPAYGAFASKVNRIRLITWVTLFFISNIVIFWILGASGARVGMAFFIWVGIFNVLVIAQFWAFANDIYDEAQGKRLFPIVGVGASVGAVVGAGLAERLFSIFGAYRLMALAGFLLLVCIVISHWVNRRSGRKQGSAQAQVAKQPLGKEGGFQLIRRQRYLLLIATLLVLLNVVNTTGEYLMGRLLVGKAESLVAAGALAASQKEAFIGEFFGDFYTWQNLVGMLFQMFLVSRVFKYIGVRGALFILPCLALGSYGLVIALPALGVVRVAKVLENGTDYSIQNTTRHALFLPTSREAKYKAQAAIETFFWRAGDVLSALMVFVGVRLAFGVSNYATVNVVLVLLWLVVSAGIFREHKKLTSDKLVAEGA